MRHCALLIATFLALSPRAFAQGTNGNPIDYATVRFERILHAQRVSEAITIDGKLTEKSWELAEHASTSRNGSRTRACRRRTTRSCGSSSTTTPLRRGAVPGSRHQAPDVNELKKDFEGTEGDTVGIFLDTLHDRQTGFFFVTNPAGARRDLQGSRDGDQLNQDWDGVWDVKVTIDDEGWTAEFVIPFKTLRFSGAAQQIWGLNSCGGSVG